jgi:hypothetical protein
VVARELVRFLRPGGRFVLGNWKADGMIGEVFKLLGSALPKPPFASRPPRWGDEAHVREPLPGLPVTLAFEEPTARAEFPTVDE